MGILTPAEIRYTTISLVALIVMTGILGFMGLSATGGGSGSFEPTSSVNLTNGSGDVVDPSNPATYDAFEPSGDLLSKTFYGYIGDFLELVTDGIAFPFEAMNRWIQMVANAGWAAAFILIPSIVMLLIVANAVYQIAKALPYT